MGVDLIQLEERTMPLNTQISVYLKHRVGSLNELCTDLSDAGINIKALSTVDDIDWAVVELIVDDIERAKVVLGKLELRYAESLVLTIELENKPGALAEVIKPLSENNINIVHTFLTGVGRRSLLVLHTTDNKKADAIIRHSVAEH